MPAWARLKMTSRTFRPRLLTHPAHRLHAQRRRRERRRQRALAFVLAYEQRDELGARIVRLCESYGAEFWFEVTRAEYVVLISRKLVVAERRLPAFAVRLLKHYRVHVIQHLAEHPLGTLRYKLIRNVPPGASL